MLNTSKILVLYLYITKNGTANGNGFFKDSEGRVLSGIWKNSKLIKRDN